MSFRKCLVIGAIPFMLWGVCFGSLFVGIDTGYRWDRINNTFENIFADRSIYHSQEDRFMNLQTYQLGARGYWIDPQYCLAAKGAGHYGWLLSGDYNNEDAVRGDLTGHAIDGTGGIGYLFSVCNCFDFVPFIGFSYDTWQLRVKNSASFDPDAFSDNAEGARMHTSWYGPWVGFDFLFAPGGCYCLPLFFNAGYEFHYGWSHIKWQQPFNNPDALAFSYSSHLKNMVGHVFHIEGNYTFCSHWFMGLRLQYTTWYNTHKNKQTLPPTSETLLGPDDFQRGREFLWRSFGLTYNLGFCF